MLSSIKIEEEMEEWKKKLIEDSDPFIISLTDVIPRECRSVAIDNLHTRRTEVFARLKNMRERVREAEREVEARREAEREVEAEAKQYTTAINLLLFKPMD
jgi:GTPase involved in cell partitioning and DNA repair